MCIDDIDKRTIPGLEDKNSMNYRLYELYNSITEEVWNIVEKYNNKEQNLTNPFMLCVPEDYPDARMKTMIVGKEPFGWMQKETINEPSKGFYAKKNTVDRLMKFYDFNMIEQVRQNKMYCYQDWNLIYHTWTNEHENGVSLLMNNVGFIGFPYSTSGFDPKINRIFNEILKKEIEICQPDLLIFMTGPDYDGHIEERLGKFKRISIEEGCQTLSIKPIMDMTGIDEHGLSFLNFENKFSYGNPIILYSYHPYYLYRIANNVSMGKLGDKFDSLHNALISKLTK